MASTVKEKSPLHMTIVHKDENGDPLVPTKFEWRLDDVDNDTEIVGWTNVGSPTATMQVVIPGSNHIIGLETNVKESRMFGVRINDTLTSEAHSQFKYDVLNLIGPSGA